jgi:amino acid adenylation domain-containing protein
VAKEIAQLTEQHATRPFDLARAPLLRVQLVRASAADHTLLMSMHHIIWDGWSSEVFFRDLWALYDGAELPPLAVQHVDYTEWRRRRLDSGELDRQLAYWDAHLAGATNVAEIRPDRKRPTMPAYRGEHLWFHVDGDTLARLKSVCRANDVTLFMMLLASMEMLLWRYTGQSDVRLGTGIANRNFAEAEELIGCVVNMLVLRGHVDGAMPFADLLRQARQTALGAYTHQDVPFEALVERFEPQRSPNRTPLFQVAFALQNTPRQARVPGGLTVTVDHVVKKSAKFDLSVEFVENGDGLDLRFEYDTDLFELATVQRIGRQLVHVLRAAAADPNRRVAELTAAREDDLRQVEEWNRTARNEAVPATVVEAFAARAAQCPSAVAVVWRDVDVTYAELNRRANRLAHILIANGVGRGTLVCVCLDRSVETVVAFLAVLKAGGAYVPLDARNLDARMPAMVADGVRLMIADRPWPGVRTIPLEDSALAAMPEHDPAVAVDGGDAAYVMYTSGSTGRPKGVVVEQRSIVSLVCATDYVSLGADDRVAQASTLEFDAATFEVWGALLNGGSLVLMPKDLSLESRRFTEWLLSNGITALFLTTAMFNEMVRDGAGFESVRHLLFGGEMVNPEAVRALLARREGRPARILHVYGPTECTTFSCWSEVAAVADHEWTVPIGRPLANVQAYVVGREMELLPVGAPGELCIAGGGVARGYLGQPGLTAERFAPLPFGVRMYRTGDLVRYRNDGAIEFLGRLDDQVKIRGFRIELGEIEAALANHPEVQQCTVVALGEPGGDRRLVAYVVAARQSTVKAADLKAFLAAKLPHYMIPSAFVRLDKLPLNRNGKVDRAALPHPDEAHGDGAAWRAPHTPLQETLCALFEDTLGVSNVGIDQNFFELGGHSLLATRLLGRLRRAGLAANLSIGDLFEAPTVEGLAVKIEAPAAPSPSLQRIPRGDGMPLSFAQQRLWFLSRLEGPSHTYVVPLAFRITGALDREALRQALRDLVARHESLRTLFPESGGLPVQRILSTDDLVVPLDVRATTESALMDDLAALVRRGFDLAAEIPLRAHLLALGPEQQVLLLVLHHIAADVSSMRPLMRDLGAAYAARLRGSAPALPELRVQYADYAAWQQQALGSESDPASPVAAQLQYWKAKLAGAPEELPLPFDRPRPAICSYRGAVVPVALGAEMHERLLRLARRSNTTLFMVVQAAVAALLTRLGGGEDISIGTPFAARKDAALEELIGFFVNTLVLRTDTSGNPTFLELLARVQKADLAAYAHGDIPFERLVEELKPERSLARQPLFQVMIAVHRDPEPLFAGPGLTVERQAPGWGVSKFDLTFGLQERRGDDGTALGLDGGIRYSTDLFERETVESMAQRLVRLLEAVAENPAERIGAIDLLSAAERAQLLGGYHEPAIPEATLATLFEEHPAEATAIVGAMTYGELNERANRLAHSLIAKGVGPETTVGVSMPRSPELVVALLGIVKAGAAYLPLDPEYPAARLELMIQDARPVCILTADDVRNLSDELPTTNPQRRGSAENACYVMYTSGSTGTPKGIVIPQCGVIRLVRNTDYVEIERTDVIAQIANSSFDAMTFEIWGALLNGAAISIVEREVSLSPARLEERLRRDGVTALFLTTALFNTMARERSGIFKGLRYVLFGGEAVDPQWPQKVLSEGAPQHLLHVYGPTETTTYATWEEVRSVDAATIPIGEPIANTKAYVLDAHLQPVPEGVRGELYLAGKGLARGYLARGGQTSERFLANPYGEAGERMYRTGDVVRRNRNGRIEFVGRSDEQVKIRGFRVELGEIEAALRELGAAQAVVIAREDAPGEKRIIGYVAGEHLDGEALRSVLRERLPEYMTPSAIVVLEALPLNANGKVDRKALPAPELAQKGWRAPRTPQEEILCALFAETLGVEHVGIDDNFFELGGHSLLAMRLVSRMRKKFGITVTVADVFDAPTPCAIAAIVTHAIVAEVSQLSDAEADRLVAASKSDS